MRLPQTLAAHAALLLVAAGAAAQENETGPLPNNTTEEVGAEPAQVDNTVVAIGAFAAAVGLLVLLLLARRRRT